MEKLFGSKITRRIWGDPENVLLVYAGAAAEFTLHPENHWLFYTGKMPSDPLRRFRDTLKYQQKLFFMPAAAVPHVARHIKDMHRQVEEKRSQEQGPMRIPDEAYTQVFSMLIEYGIRGYEYLHHCKLGRPQREDYFNDIRAIAQMMEVEDFPQDYGHYLDRRTDVVVNQLQFNPYTRELMEAYRRNLGPIRYWVLRQFQARFIDLILVYRLGLTADPFFGFIHWIYPYVRVPGLFNRLARLFLGEKAGRGIQKPVLGTE